MSRVLIVVCPPHTHTRTHSALLNYTKFYHSIYNADDEANSIKETNVRASLMPRQKGGKTSYQSVGIDYYSFQSVEIEGL